MKNDTKALLIARFSSPRNKKLLLTLIISFISLLIVYFWLHSERYISTEDAYLNANIVQVAPRVTGQVSQLYVNNNQFVRKGQVLMELDQTPFIVASNKVRAQLKIDEAQLQNAMASADRTVTLVKKKTLSAQSGDDAATRLQSAAASVQLSKANLSEAELDLRYTRIVASTNGWVTNMTTQVGNIVQQNQPIFALVSNAEFWVDANFKETELEKLKPGQTATIKSDMHPRHPFKGVIESISYGSGAAFSLLPPQNATGNWVKVTQRVPVRVRILNVDPRFPLRIGTTATVTIDTHSLG